MIDKETKNESVNQKPGAASFEKRRFSIGIFSTATVLAVIAVFVVVNLFVGSLNLSMDLTGDRLFSISDETRDFLRQIDEPITIYTLFRQGGEIIDIQEILNQYASASSHIRVVNRDPFIYRNFVAQFGDGIAVNSIIIESDRRHRVIHAHEFERRVVIDWEATFQAGYEVGVVSFDLEPRVTNALVFVTQEVPFAAYHLIGHHGPTAISPSMESFLREAGYEFRQHNSALGAIPESCDVLIITTPQRDITEDEATHLHNYLSAGGAALFLIGTTNTELPNLMGVMEAFGVTVNTAYIIHEGNTDYFFDPHPINLSPRMAGHRITLRLHTAADVNRLYMPFSVAVETMSMLPPNIVSVDNLITTSSQAFLKTSQGRSSHFEPGDTRGEFSVAIGITHDFDLPPQVIDGITVRGARGMGRIAVIGNEVMIYDAFDTFLNRLYIVETMNWLINRSDRDIFIPTRTVQITPPVFVTASQSNALWVFIFVFPTVIMGAGVGVWLKRRNS